MKSEHKAKIYEEILIYGIIRIYLIRAIFFVEYKKKRKHISFLVTIALSFNSSILISILINFITQTKNFTTWKIILFKLVKKPPNKQVSIYYVIPKYYFKIFLFLIGIGQQCSGKKNTWVYKFSLRAASNSFSNLF